MQWFNAKFRAEVFTFHNPLLTHDSYLEWITLGIFSAAEVISSLILPCVRQGQQSHRFIVDFHLGKGELVSFIV